MAGLAGLAGLAGGDVSDTRPQLAYLPTQCSLWLLSESALDQMQLVACRLSSPLLTQLPTGCTSWLFSGTGLVSPDQMQSVALVWDGLCWRTYQMHSWLLSGTAHVDAPSDQMQFVALVWDQPCWRISRLVAVRGPCQGQHQDTVRCSCVRRPLLAHLSTSCISRPWSGRAPVGATPNQI